MTCGLSLRAVSASSQGGQHVQIERFADAARFLGAVQHRQGLDGGRQGARKCCDGEGPVEADRQHADLFALRR